MKKAFLFVLAVTVLASFFASADPDGLEKVAGDLGFVEKARERDAIMTDYNMAIVPDSGVSTASAGIGGVLITLSVFWLTAFMLKGKS